VICAGCGGSGQTYNQAPTSSTTTGGVGSATVSGRVWLDPGAGGSRSAIPGVAVDLLTPSGARSVATDSGGRFTIAAPAGVALTLEIPVLQDSLQGLKPTRESSRSLGSDTGDLDVLAIAPRQPGAQLTGRDFDFEPLASRGQ
jgi:hypothetical protein